MSELIVGVDIGGTSIKLGALNALKKIKYREVIPTVREADDKEFLESLYKGISSLKNQFKSGETLKAIGVGSPGPLDSEKGIVFTSPNLKNLKRCQIKPFLEKKFGVRVYIQNDASCAAIGHKFFGLGKKDSDFAVFTLGTGVGGGLLLNHKLFTGHQGNGFEVGHTPIADKSFLETEYYVKCGCGSHGCLETFASASAVVKMYNFFQKQKSGKKFVSFPKEVVEYAEKKDPLARKVFKIVGRSLGLASSQLIQALNLPLLIFTGGLSVSSHLFAKELEGAIEEKVFPMFHSRTRVKYTVGNEDFAILGAAALCFDHSIL